MCIGINVAAMTCKATQLAMNGPIKLMECSYSRIATITRIIAIAHTFSDATSAFFFFGGAPDRCMTFQEAGDVGTGSFFPTTDAIFGLNTGTSGASIGGFAITSIDFRMVPVRRIQHGTGPCVVVIGVVAMGATRPMTIA